MFWPWALFMWRLKLAIDELEAIDYKEYKSGGA